MNTHLKSWAEEDRPREKLMLKGRSVLSDAELIAIILGSGTRSQSAVDLARSVLQANQNDLAKLSRMSQKDLCRMKGIGPAKAISIIAALELGRRRKDAEKGLTETISSSVMVYEHMRYRLMDLEHEEFWIILLNRANEVLRTERVSVGGMSGTVADGKIIFRKALEFSAHGLILVHNHPSGQLRPSDNDRSLTKKMVEFGKYIDLPVLDHLIFTDNGYYSFADEGMLGR
jgi:DNA repair protein RadC